MAKRRKDPHAVALARTDKTKSGSAKGKKNPHAVVLGRKGGLASTADRTAIGRKGGLTRARGMRAKQRSEAARKAARARWAK